jgi:hypothetical protein
MVGAGDDRYADRLNSGPSFKTLGFSVLLFTNFHREVCVLIFIKYHFIHSF